jgi:hypothetical protein
MTPSQHYINWNDIRLAVDVYEVPQATGQVFVLHGAGKSSKQRMEPICNQFVLLGQRVVALDFEGHGAAGGTLEGSSLSRRLAQAQAVGEEFLCPEMPLSIVGCSMSGHTAVELLRDLHVAPIQNLILFAPATYASDAEQLGFGTAFGGRIRQADSWRSSIIPNILSSFRGGVFIFVGDDDTIVPREVIQMYISCTQQAQVMACIRVPNVDHRITTALGNNPALLNRVFGVIRQLAVRPQDLLRI